MVGRDDNVVPFALLKSSMRAKGDGGDNPPYGTTSTGPKIYSLATTGPSIAILPFTVVSDDVELDKIAVALRARVEGFFDRWNWLEVVKTPSAPRRYTLRCTLGRARGSNNGISVNIYMTTPAPLKRGGLHVPLEGDRIGEVLLYAPSSSYTSKNERLSKSLKEVVSCAINDLYEKEERIGREQQWTSGHFRQNTFWAFILWMKATKRDNSLARRMAKLATETQEGRESARAWAMLARTYIEGIAYKWDTDTRAAMNALVAYALKAVARDDDDVVAREMFANSLLYKGRLDSAIEYLGSSKVEPLIFPTAASSLGLMNSYNGNFTVAEEILLGVALQCGEDRALAVGLQYLAQVQCLLRRYDEGVVTAERALSLNPASTPATRTLAVSYSGCGRMLDACRKLAEAELLSPGFTASVYRERQPWHRRASAAMAIYVDCLRAAGAPAY